MQADRIQSLWQNHTKLWYQITLAFLTNMREKFKPISTSPSEIQVQNQQKTIGIEEKWDIISQREKGECIVDICCNVKLPYNSIHDDDRITHSAKSGPKVFV